MNNIKQIKFNTLKPDINSKNKPNLLINPRIILIKTTE